MKSNIHKPRPSVAQYTGGNLATREDILVTKGELTAEIQGVRNVLHDGIQDVRSELRDQIQDVRSELKAEIHDVQGHIRVLYWMTGTTLACVVGILGIAITIGLHLIHLE
jgi:hypothetical protein